MSQVYKEFKGLDLPGIAEEMLNFWQKENIFLRSIEERNPSQSFVFYEGPPSANGMPGIHHVMARTIKDIFCRYQTLAGKRVNRKAGWDTHGLPIELAVEKTLGLRKEDIGVKISVEEYNSACRKEVMKYTDKWEELTRIMGYWVDMSTPYITYENKYIESVWWLLKKIYDKKLLYKGFTIQPYSPAAGTGLSSHELNQPGAYREVKDTSAVVMFSADGFRSKDVPFIQLHQDWLSDTIGLSFLAWTTTPWTLPSNTALAVGKSIEYVVVESFNSYSHQPIRVVLAKNLMGKYFPENDSSLSWNDYQPGDKNIPFRIVAQCLGSDLEKIAYHQLLPFAQPQEGDAFRVIVGDFVTTEDGTGIVHIAPSFGADDFRAARQNGIGSLTLVDKRGRFLPVVQDGRFLYGDEYVKEAYYSDDEKAAELSIQKEKLAGIIKDTGKLAYLSVDDRIVLRLQHENRLFKKEKYEHNYPHCWRTDKPVIYYPLDSWFIKISDVRERMAGLNKTINWKPESTGSGRFGNWLENANDWNLSRSRFWGIPLPVWRTEDGAEELCIGSAEELKNEINRSVSAGYMQNNPLGKYQSNVHSAENYASFDLHKPYADEIFLVSTSGKKMTRESDLIDVWFDSGAMPYAQLHYPFENKDQIDKRTNFPADFIAEGVDQTRGWFYTLHAIATLCFDSVAYKNVISNGLVLDKNGNKMSKRLGNAVDPFTTIAQFGPDATRWYMIGNAQPWDNLKFDTGGIAEVQRKFFGTLYNTYSFFSIYANIDRFRYDQQNKLPISKRSELDRWIISCTESLKNKVCELLDDYNPTPAVRAMENYLDEHLSNWYVRLSRKRFWHGEPSADKKAAYETLYECLVSLAQLISPVAPFFGDWLYKNLTDCIREDARKIDSPMKHDSVHLTLFQPIDESIIDKELEERMELGQKISSMILSIRKKENIRVRQPLHTARIPVLDETFRHRVEAVKGLILSEVNIKHLDLVDESQVQIVKNLKLNFKTLGKKCGKFMKDFQSFAQENQQNIIKSMGENGSYPFQADSATIIEITNEDVEIMPVDIPGWKVANSGALTVALDISVTDDLRLEGIAREFVNRIQTLRKDAGLEVTDKISVKIEANLAFNEAINSNSEYIRSQVLAGDIQLAEKLADGHLVEIDEGIATRIFIQKMN
ncbi:MAG: isoleucine--tRNA ligase [Crocinitomicaceae bacterium]|nr:isoleucine--tRNA ligase [Crocinitomicaceae bacterium]